MRDYWSCSKLADWIRGVPKPHSATPEEWASWEKKAKIKPVRYWLAEEGLDLVQNIVLLPLNILRNLLSYIDNRWIHKTHALTSILKPGKWHDLDTRLLHSLFDELVNFVEIELALINLASEKYSISWYHKFTHFIFWRNSEAGIEYLDWSAQLKHDEEWDDKNNPNYNQPTSQAIAAQEILRLYEWWKKERPNRPDPMDASGWSEYCEKKRQGADPDDDLGWISCNSNDEERRKILDLCHKMEKEQEDEDTEMLIRLIKIRSSLWT